MRHYTLVAMLIAHFFLPQLADESGSNKQIRESPRSEADFRNYVELDSFIFGNDVELSVYAAWERCSREASNIENASTSIERFLGFVEGRLCVSIPPAWQQVVCSANFSERGNVTFGPIMQTTFVQATNDQRHYPMNITPQFRVDFSDPTKAQLIGDKIGIPLHNFDDRTGSFQVGSTTLNGSYLAITAIDGKDAIVGDCSLAPRPFPLLRIDDQGKLVWESSVHCYSSRRNELFTGNIDMITEIVTGSRIVVVFGYTKGIAYAEGFGPEDGSSLFRFSSGNWETR